MNLKCPICGREMLPQTKAKSRKEGESVRYFPFCSKRCKLIDLGAWLDADYRILGTEETLGGENESNR